MINIPTKTKDRLTDGLKRFKPIIKRAIDNDINESDTVIIVSDILSEMFDYDKYEEITSEYAVKRTYCDLAVKLDGEPLLLVECKAIGINLKDNHIRQAVDYGSNSGIDWVVLTNAVSWRVYKILFTRPVAYELVYEFDLTQVSSRRQTDLEMLYYLTKEAMRPNSKTSLDDFRAQKQILSKYIIGQIILQDTTLNCIRRMIKKIAPEARVSAEEIKLVLTEDVLKREVLDAEMAGEARKRVMKAVNASAKRAKKTNVE